VNSQSSEGTILDLLAGHQPMPVSGCVAEAGESIDRLNETVDDLVYALASPCVWI
jgi:hypothetical protein